jgi:PAS domain S-box-containing protein
MKHWPIYPESNSESPYKAKKMQDGVKTKGRFANELEGLRQLKTRMEISETDRKKLEEELSIVYDALSSSVSGVIITNLEGQIQYVNPAFLRIFGYREKTEILGKNAVDLFPTEDVKKFADVKAIIDETRGETEEFIAQHKDDTKFPVEVSSSNVTDNIGNIVGRMASFIDLTERKQAKKTIQESKKQIRVLSSRLLEAEEEERKRIARDLHDIIGSSLTAIKYSLEKQVDNMAKLPIQERTSLEQVVSMVQNTIKETKRIYRSLRPPILDDLGILATINWSCREFQDVYTGIRIEKSLEIEEDKVPKPLKIVIYKLLLEALNNIVKHSGANLVRLSLRETEGNLELSVKDNGRGFDLKEILSRENHASGLGLASMRERVEVFGGSFEIWASQKKGTTILASWPCI